MFLFTIMFALVYVSRLEVLKALIIICKFILEIQSIYTNAKRCLQHERC